MVDNLARIYERSKIGPTLNLAFSDSSSARLELKDDVEAQNNRLAPTVFILRTTEDVHLRQGGNTVEATTADFLLSSGSYMQILVEDSRDNHIAAIAPTGKSGTLFATEGSSV